jgi:hypothetical protein
MTAAKCGTKLGSQGLNPILALFSLHRVLAKGTTMTKTLDVITEAIKAPKNPFRQAADRPDKPHKHRYERRRVKQYIQLGDWAGEARP